MGQVFHDEKAPKRRIVDNIVDNVDNLSTAYGENIPCMVCISVREESCRIMQEKRASVLQNRETGIRYAVCLYKSAQNRYNKIVFISDRRSSFDGYPVV